MTYTHAKGHVRQVRASARGSLSRCSREQRTVTGAGKRKGSVTSMTPALVSAMRTRAVCVHVWPHQDCSLSGTLLWVLSFESFWFRPGAPCWLFSRPIHVSWGHILLFTIHSAVTLLICLMKQDNVTLEITLRPLLVTGSPEFRGR